MIGRDQEIDELDKQWMQVRKEYRAFSHDGILSDRTERYYSSDIRIAFLLKEAPVGSYPIDNSGGMKIRGINTSSTSKGCGKFFWKRLGMWTYVINEVRHGGAPSINGFYYFHNNGGYPLSNVAYVNLKKGDGRRRSSFADLIRYAKQDKVFLNRQILLLNPDVIVCCSTYRIYAEHVFDGTAPRGSQSAPVWDNYNKRIIIDWHHPTARCKEERDFCEFKTICEKAFTVKRDNKEEHNERM